MDMRVRTGNNRKKGVELDATGFELFAPLCDKILCIVNSLLTKKITKNTTR